MAQKVVWRKLFCQGSGCGLLFYICGSCYRGQVYCGAECRRRARLGQQRRANRRYAQDPGVRADHCQRQREYRDRCRRRRVTDHTSPGSGRSVNIGVPLPETGRSMPLAEIFGDRPRLGRPQTAIRIVCIVCGRVGMKKITQEREKR